MSSSKTDALERWKDVRSRIGRNRSTWRGQGLSKVDQGTWNEMIFMWALVLHDLSNRFAGLGCFRDHVNFAMRMATVDADSLASFLSEFIVDWRNLSEDSYRVSISSYTSLKKKYTPRYPFAGVFFGVIGGAIDDFLQSGSASNFYPVYQLASFPTHLTLRDLNQGLELEQAYLDNEEHVGSHTVPDYLLRDLREIITDWFRDFQVRSEDFVPGHGPGSVAELKGDISLASKYALLGPSPSMRYVFSKFADVDVDECCPLSLTSRVTTTRQSAIVFVAKSMKTKRVISKEPATLMYFQQGIDRCIREYISRHPYLRSRIDLNDQS